MSDIKPYTSRPIYDQMQKMVSDDISWGSLAVKILENIEPGKQYHLSEMAKFADFEFDIENPKSQIVLTAAIALGNFPEPALDVRFFILHEGDKVLLPKDEMSDLIERDVAKHPVTGAPIPSPQEKFFMIFEAI